MLQIGDIVRTNADWNKHDTPIDGVVTEIIPLLREPFPLIELNGGQYRLNGFWLEKVNNDWLDMC